MSNTPASNDGLEVVVNDDGGVTVSAADLARLGLRPGAHLRLVPEYQPEQSKRKSVRGSLAHLVKPGDMDDFVAAMAEMKAERVAALLTDNE